MTQSESLVDFYRNNKISPVRQEIKDLAEHFERRSALYRHMGILNSTISGRRVVEIGPGSGFNSLYTASLKPASYTLVEGNPTGVAHIRELFAQYPPYQSNLIIEQSLLEDFHADDLFDVVLCEGLLSGVPAPKETIGFLKRLVRPDGLLVITCIDHISYFSDTVRRYLAHILLRPEASLSYNTELLLPAFSPHLNRLSGMSRLHGDWIIDNLLNPASIGPLCSIPMALEALGPDFQFFGSSPHFVSDWRWYKTIKGSELDYNKVALAEFWRYCHNFLNHARVYPPRPPDANRLLHDLCVAFRDELRNFESTRTEVSKLETAQRLEEVAFHVRDFCSETAAAISEVVSLVRRGPFSPEDVGKLELFGTLVGRGQQYLSFTRG